MIPAQTSMSLGAAALKGGFLEISYRPEYRNTGKDY